MTIKTKEGWVIIVEDIIKKGLRGVFDENYLLFPPLPLSVILRNDRDKPGNHGDGSEDEEYWDGYDGHNHDYDDDDDAVDDDE